MSKHVAYSAITGQILQWQDSTAFQYAAPPDHVQVLAVTDDQWNDQARFGWVASGELTNIEPLPIVAQPDTDELELMCIAQRDALLAEATVIMAPLQDAMDLDDATPRERSALTAWKRYRVAVNRISDQPGFPLKIEWPEAPEHDNRPSRRHAR